MVFRGPPRLRGIEEFGESTGAGLWGSCGARNLIPEILDPKPKEILRRGGLGKVSMSTEGAPTVSPKPWGVGGGFLLARILATQGFLLFLGDSPLVCVYIYMDKLVFESLSF